MPNRDQHAHDVSRRRNRSSVYTPKLFPLWVVLPIWLAAGAVLIGLIWLYVRTNEALVGTNTPQIEITKVVLTLTAGVGAVLAGVYAYRKQRLEEGTSHRADAASFADRYNSAADQLGSDAAAIRLAGAYAMARLADDWLEQRQVCVDVLCGYLRMQRPSVSDTKDSDKDHEQEVRATIQSLIATHLLDPLDARSWSPLNFNLERARLVDLDLDGTAFSGHRTSFARATFSGARTTLVGTTFSSDRTSFTAAEFTAEATSFNGAKFSGDRASFAGAQFTGARATFSKATFSSEETSFDGAKFSGDLTSFDGAKFSGSTTGFAGAAFSGSRAQFDKATFTADRTSFANATFTASKVPSDKTPFGRSTSFEGVTFSGGSTLFGDATFSADKTSFGGATFGGGSIWFGAKFSGDSTWFDKATFSAVRTSFDSATFTAERTSFTKATFTGASLRLPLHSFSARVHFDRSIWQGPGAFSFDSAHNQTALPSASVHVTWNNVKLLNGAQVTLDGKPFRGWPPSHTAGPQ